MADDPRTNPNLRKSSNAPQYLNPQQALTSAREKIKAQISLIQSNIESLSNITDASQNDTATIAIGAEKKELARLQSIESNLQDTTTEQAWETASDHNLLPPQYTELSLQDIEKINQDLATIRNPQSNNPQDSVDTTNPDNQTILTPKSVKQQTDQAALENNQFEILTPQQQRQRQTQQTEQGEQIITPSQAKQQEDQAVLEGKQLKVDRHKVITYLDKDKQAGAQLERLMLIAETDPKAAEELFEKMVSRSDWTFYDPSQKKRSLLGAQTSFDAWDATLQLQESSQLEKDMQTGTIDKHQLNAIYGYHSGTFYNAITSYEDKYKANGKWIKPEYAEQHLHLQQQADAQAQWEANHMTQAGSYYNRWRNYEGMFAFDKDLNPAILTKDEHGTRVMTREESTEQGHLFAAPPKYNSNHEYRRLQLNKIQELYKNKQLGMRVNKAGSLVLSSKKGLKTYTKRMTDHAKDLAAKGIKKAGRKVLGKLARSALIKGTAALAGAVLTAGIGTAIVVGGTALQYLKKYKDKAVAALFYAYLKLAAFLKSLFASAWTIGGAAVGGTLGFLVAGPFGAAAGAIVGGWIGRMLGQRFMGMGPAEGAGLTAKAVTSGSASTTKFGVNAVGQPTATTTAVATEAARAELAAMSTGFMFTATVFPFILTAAMVMFTMGTILVAFTVPNPQDPQFAADASRFPGGPNNTQPIRGEKPICLATYGKLSLFAGQVDTRLYEFLDAVRPPVIKLFDQALNDANQVRQLYPGIIILGRWYNESAAAWGNGFIDLPEEYQPVFDDEDESMRRAIAAANAWMNNHQATNPSPAVNYWEGLIKPKTFRDVSLRDDTDRSHLLMRWLAKFEATRIELMAAEGQLACIGNFGFGHPNPNLWPEFQEAFDALETYGGTVCLQEYATNYEAPVDGETMGRYRKMYDYLGESDIKTIISTTGVNRKEGIEGENLKSVGWRSLLATDVQKFLNIMSVYDRYITNDDRVLGATMFQYHIPDNERVNSELDPEIIDAMINGANQGTTSGSVQCIGGDSSGNYPQSVSGYNGPLSDLIAQATQLACIPTALFNAILDTETGAFNIDPSFYDTYGWWEGANPNGQSCYATPKPGDTSNRCLTGYCYDNSSNVWGITQFTTSTFYGGCSDPEGKQPGCESAYTRFVKEQRGYPDNLVPNRCRAGDAIYATAAKLAYHGGVSNPGQCLYNPELWNKDNVCLIARSYCGSCGAIEDDPDNPIYRDMPQPCKEHYLAPEANSKSDRCGAIGTIGYCNQVYLEFEAQRQGQ